MLRGYRATGAASAALVLLCCNAIVGNDDVELEKASDGSSSGGTPSGGGTGGGSATGGSGGALVEAGDGASASDAKEGGDGAAPKVIQCGSTQCDAESGYCCVTASESKCWAPGVACQGLDLACDGPEDCLSEGGALICCATKADGGTKPAHVKCQPSCAADQWVVCGSVATACATGTTCQPSPNFPQYKLCL